VGAASVGLVLSVAVSPFAAADDPVGSPSPSESATVAASPTPTASPDLSVTPTGSESASPSVVTTPDVTASPTPAASVTPSPAEQQSPSQGVGNTQLAAATGVSGVLRDATTGAPIPNSCVAWRPASVTSTATNGTIRVGEKGRWSIDGGDPGPFYISFYVTEDGDCSQAVLTGPDNYRASWYRGEPFIGTDPSTALPPPGADPVAAGSNVVACLATNNALPAACATPNRTASGRVVGVGPKPIFQACIVAIGPNDTELGFAMSDADGRWKMSGLPINYDYIVGVIPPFKTSEGPCTTGSGDGPPPAPPSGALQPEFYDDTWADFSDPNLRDDPFSWATDPNSPHPAIAMRNNRTGINVCLTTETGRDTQRGSCDPGTPTPTPTVTAPGTASSSTQPTLAATGGPSPLTPALGAALLLGAVGLLARSRSILRRSRWASSSSSRWTHGHGSSMT
jgi:hypothetical protein